ncbi:hypothetical protein BU26DRAFT_135423 [Trematosphaeria pertusa]|uniref:Uncharacterized protein n=1 Tax=Trematosphaeria pertusa TaxID=390896 RepID=A0A6A6IYJ7_9PLEO|nr:uncharacterized protein BU26DRAFT_135423 [Trematosphaeria pertusa]KAF2254263.1 hypothetical protein BU26DRAFT_135423 [Trematosphaeria pertusa]
MGFRLTRPSSRCSWSLTASPLTAPRRPRCRPYHRLDSGRRQAQVCVDIVIMDCLVEHGELGWKDGVGLPEVLESGRGGESDLSLGGGWRIGRIGPCLMWWRNCEVDAAVWSRLCWCRCGMGSSACPLDARSRLARVGRFGEGEWRCDAP